MEVQVTHDERAHHPNVGSYRFFIAQCETTEVHVIVAPRHVTIAVNNAPYKVWRGMGQDYPSLAAARPCYRSEAVRTILEHLEKLP